MNKKIGLYDVDNKIGHNFANSKKIYPNLALMKLSAYYKKKNYDIDWYSPLFYKQYYKIFASKIFTYSSEKTHYLYNEIIKGGSGYDLQIKLPDKIEHIYPDYSLYGIDYAMGFITRGCIRKCPFCVVWKKEGNIHKHANLDEFCKEQERIQLLDNNILAYENHIEELEILKEINKRIDFNQGLDIRLITNENAKILSKIKRWKNTDLRFAFDDPKLEQIIIKKTKILKKNGIKRGYFYMLIGFNTTFEEDLKRIKILDNLGHRIYIMPYNKKDLYQKIMRKYINRFFYRKMTFEYFKKKYYTRLSKN